MKIGLRGVVRGECGIAYAEFFLRNGAKVERPKVVGVLGSRHLKGTHLLCFEIKKGSLAGQNLIRCVKADVSNEKDITGLGVVFRIVGKDAVFSVVDLNVVLGNGDAFLEAGIAVGRDLDGDITKVPELGASAWQQGQHAQNKQELPHEAPKLNIQSDKIKGGFEKRFKTQVVRRGMAWSRFANHRIRSDASHATPMRFPLWSEYFQSEVPSRVRDGFYPRRR